MNNLDLALHRAFPLRAGGQARLELRAEAFNLFNRPQFGQPGNTLGTPTAGVINATSGVNRRLQFAAGVTF